MSYEENARNDGFGLGYPIRYGYDAIVVENGIIPKRSISPKNDSEPIGLISRAIRATLDEKYGGKDPNARVQQYIIA